MKTKLAAFMAAMVIALSLIGCASGKLAPGGAYHPTDTNGVAISAPDAAFFAVDSSYRIAYNTVDTVFLFENDNRAMLWALSPTIKHTLDNIRPQAVAANVEYHKARDAYIANPVPANLDLLKQVLAKMQQLTATATAVLPKGNP